MVLERDTSQTDRPEGYRRAQELRFPAEERQHELRKRRVQLGLEVGVTAGGLSLYKPCDSRLVAALAIMVLL